MSMVKSIPKFAIVALFAGVVLGAASPASAGRSTGSWKYYNPYYTPVPDYYSGGAYYYGGVPYYGGGYYGGYSPGWPAYGYDDEDGYRERYWRRRYLRDTHEGR
jgi:hypothetical protein